MTSVGILSSDAPAYRAELESSKLEIEMIEPGRSGGDLPPVLLADPPLVAGVGRLDGVEWIQSTWAGIDRLDWSVVPSSTVVTGLPGVFGPQMREFVFGHLLSITQRTDRPRHRWDETPPGLLEGARLGILGAGSIGGALAETARHFGMEVRGCSRSGRADDRYRSMWPVAEILSFAEGLDHLVSVLPSTDATRRLVDAAVLDRLNPGAVLVNVGRGATVVLDDVLDAVRSGQLIRGVLDVTEPEPLPDDHPAWSVPGVVITGHTAAISRPDVVVERFVENLDRRRRGVEPIGAIDRSIGY